MSSPGSTCSLKFHVQELAKHCRICGKRFSRGAREEPKEKQLISTCYAIDTEKDDAKIHPPQVCYACVCKMKRIKATRGEAYLRTRPTLFEWTPHTDVACCMCDHFETTVRGGRPKKQQPVGRQSGEPTSRTLEVLLEAGGASFVSGVSPSRLLAASHHLREEVVCVVCQAIVDTPVQLHCDHLACVPCIHQHITMHGPTCPGCLGRLDSTHFSKCTSLVQKVIGCLRIQCKYQCRYPVTMDALLQHQATCNNDLPQWSLTAATFGEIMEVPLTESLSADEEALCSRLVRRSAQDGKLVITTGGQVRCTHK